MAELNDLEPTSRRFLERYPFPNLPAPVLTPLSKPVSECRLAFVTTAGLHKREEPPFSRFFERSDCSYREIPDKASMKELSISHISKEFNRDGVNKDINVVLPFDRAEELVTSGNLGTVNRRHFSFMGSLPRTGDLRKRTAPEVARKLKEDQVDLVLLTPV
ncbi:MAG TPA: glycine/sarcosine/betaine reductase selenoprotein B family protein [Candidatus Melainabacteria bacterium]|nr:glycine/sarcosine/betaine reductase selenoprotein B family protein [Candidatus Melainabacteria bacterium]HMP51012.1 glycine/sarcosine/betaine reductase selenoprotein B family protein [Candidatus Melainabacteria bacterium]